MREPFNNIKVGPFAAKYHQSSVDESFLVSLHSYLAQELIPQVSIKFDAVDGRLTACYDNDRNCGPNSAVKNLYRLEVAFHEKGASEEIKTDLRYKPESGIFEERNSKPLYLWTVDRKQKYAEARKSIEEACQAIQKNNAVDVNCPLCSSMLSITNNDNLFDVRCPNGCFNYNYHREPKTREILHGHFFMKELN
jgi:hypothetical protein